MNYAEADALLGRHPRRRLRLNTYLIRAGDSIKIRLYDTDVITFRPDRFTLRAGAWRTSTTQRRINQYSPAKVYSVKGGWHVGTVLFHDGITFSQDAEGVCQVVEEQYAL